MSKQSTIMRNVVKQPLDNSAGFGVAHVRNPPPHETEYRIEQLWSDGRAEPVYIGDKGEAFALAQELLNVIDRETETATEEESDS